MVGEFRWKKKEERDHHLEEESNSNEMGLSIYTPFKGTTPIAFSPQTDNVATAPPWQVYSRTRRFQKKSQVECAIAEAHEIESQLKVISTQQQLVTDTKKERKGSNYNSAHIQVSSVQAVVEIADQGENMKQAATDIWNIAKQLGVTGAADQGRFVEKILIMEERDRKEAERLGNRVGTP